MVSQAANRFVQDCRHVAFNLKWLTPTHCRCIQSSGDHAFLRRQRKEPAGARLVVAIALAAGAQHLILKRRDAGDVDEDPVHEDRRQQGRPAPRIIRIVKRIIR